MLLKWGRCVVVLIWVVVEIVIEDRRNGDAGVIGRGRSGREGIGEW